MNGKHSSICFLNVCFGSQHRKPSAMKRQKKEPLHPQGANQSGAHGVGVEKWNSEQRHCLARTDGLRGQHPTSAAVLTAGWMGVSELCEQ